MLKKTGFVLATVATGLIGLSSLAFADNGHHRGDVDKVIVTEDNDTTNTTDNSVVRQQGNVCDFDQDATSVDLPGGLVGLPAVADAQTQAQALNCVNTGDVTGVDAPVGLPIPALG